MLLEVKLLNKRVKIRTDILYIEDNIVLSDILLRTSTIPSLESNQV